MRRSLLWRSPILLGMAMVALPALLVYFNAFHRQVAGVPIYSDTSLHGVELPVVLPPLTRHEVASGDFSRAYSIYFGRTFPLLAAAVRAKGQFYWSVLHQSPAWFISIGRHDVLYENGYLDGYCSRNIAASRRAAEAWAARLMRMQNWYASHGKLFLYLLTPSKAAIEPEFMPSGWPCEAAPADREGFHAAYRAILDHAGVNVVDAVETSLQAKADYPFPPFPPGGTHFNDLTAARAVQRLIDVSTRAGTWRRLNDLDFTWTMSEPSRIDMDLLLALNVPWTGMHYTTPMVTARSARDPHCTPVLMAQVGGSFTYQIDKILELTRCPPRIDMYEYFHNRMAFFPGDRRYPVDPRRRAWALLEAAQLVVLEENEQLMASQHGQAFYELVSRRIRAEQGPPGPPTAH